MEFLHAITLFGSIFWGVAALVVLLILFFWSDYEEQGFAATFFFVVIGTLFFFFGKETWHHFVSLLTGLNLGVYLVVGWLYALVRVFFHGRDQMMIRNKHRIEHPTWDYEIERDIKDHVFRWWLLWPVSLINWIIKDVVKDVYNFVYKYLSNMFNFIMDLGVKSVKEVPKKEKNA